MTFEIFCVTAPGLEPILAQEVAAAGFPAREVAGGVAFDGDWNDVWRANLELRGATRILARIGSFRAFHLAQLDKRATKFPWRDTLREDIPVRVEVSTRASKIYHAKAAAQRIEKALTSQGIPLDPKSDLVIKTRIDDNLVTFSIDTSGPSLHLRGHKTFVGKAPMRETLAALFLREAGYDGSEPVIDPMCGSGTFVLEAAEMSAGLQPGRSRSFAFEHLQSFDEAQFAKLKTVAQVPAPAPIFGFDRASGAIVGAQGNADKAGVDITLKHQAISDLQRPDTAPGLVIVNPPYGARIGNKKALFGLYGALGRTLSERFSGWRVSIITSDAGLAKATGLAFKGKPASVQHGGLRITHFRTDPLP